MPLIHAYFYSPNETDDHILNRLVTAYDPPYSHCDVQFEDTMASSVYSGESVYWRKRGFKKPGYSRITISADNAAAYDKAYTFCKERADSGCAFDAIGMYTLPLPDILKRDRANHTFCSKHCTEVLQQAGVKSVFGLDSKSVTPSMLYKALESRAVLHTDRIDLRIFNNNNNNNTAGATGGDTTTTTTTTMMGCYE